MRILKHTDPCDLLTKGDLAELKMASPGKKESDKWRGCTWSNRQVAFRITIRTRHGIDDFPLSKEDGGEKPSPLKVNGRMAGRQRFVKGPCEVSMRVTDTSRIDVLVSMTDHSKSCAGARQVAWLVEPHLPTVK